MLLFVVLFLCSFVVCSLCSFVVAFGADAGYSDPNATTKKHKNIRTKEHKEQKNKGTKEQENRRPSIYLYPETPRLFSLFCNYFLLVGKKMCFSLFGSQNASIGGVGSIGWRLGTGSWPPHDATHQDDSPTAAVVWIKVFVSVPLNAVFPKCPPAPLFPLITRKRRLLKPLLTVIC